jgi:hypothetical protein
VPGATLTTQYCGGFASKPAAYLYTACCQDFMFACSIVGNGYCDADERKNQFQLVLLRGCGSQHSTVAVALRIANRRAVSLLSCVLRFRFVNE